MLDLLGFVAASFLTIVMIASIAVLSSGTERFRIEAASVAALWVGIATGAAAYGLTARSHPFPFIGIFLLIPLVGGAIAAMSARFRTAFAAVPLAWLVFLNFGRIFAILFLELEIARRLAGPFPFYAGWGDIITGVVAIPLALVLRTKSPAGGFGWFVILWNLFGIADLINAIFLGVTSSVGSPLQIFNYPPGSAAMQHLPFSLVPTVLVPFYILIHVAIFARVIRAMRDQPSA
jgi:hypothetical protein